MTTNDEPVRQWTGCWLPREIILLTEEGRISHSEMVLLVTINSLVGVGHGCYASNAYLAKMMNMQPRGLCKMLARLEAAGLILKYEDETGQRHIETVYCRIDKSKIKPDLLQPNRVEEEQEHPRPTGPSPLGPQAHPPSAHRPPKKVKENVREERVVDGVANGTQSKSQLPEEGGFDLFGEGNNGGTKTYPRHSAEMLYTALAAKRKIMRAPNMGAWAETFRKFLMTSEVKRERFEAVLTWYCNNVGVDNFVPHAFSAEGFCGKFVEIVEQMRMRGVADPAIYDDPEPVEEPPPAPVVTEFTHKDFPGVVFKDVAEMQAAVEDKFFADMKPNRGRGTK